MKNLYVFFLTIIFVFPLYSQLEKGILTLDGSFNLNNSSSKTNSDFSNGNNNEFEFTFRPILQKMIKDNLSIGAGISFRKINSKSTTTYDNPLSSSSSSSSNNTFLGLSVNSTKYFTLTERVYFTLNGFIGFESGTAKDSPNYRANYFGVAIGPGIDFFLNSSFALSSSLNLVNYQNVTSKDTEANFNSSSSYFGLSLNQSSFFIGLKYFILPKEKEEEKAL